MKYHLYTRHGAELSSLCNRTLEERQSCEGAGEVIEKDVIRLLDFEESQLSSHMKPMSWYCDCPAQRLVES